jgi:hypothetical protein
MLRNSFSCCTDSLVRLSGLIPSNIGKSTNLPKLLFYLNSLAGSNLSNFEKLENLSVFIIVNNILIDAIPSLLFSTGNIEKVFLIKCQKFSRQCFTSRTNQRKSMQGRRVNKSSELPFFIGFLS